MLTSCSRLSKPFPISRHFFQTLTIKTMKHLAVNPACLGFIACTNASFFFLTYNIKIQKERQATWKQNQQQRILETFTRLFPFNSEKKSVHTPLLLTPTAGFDTLFPLWRQKKNLRKVGAQRRGGTTPRWGDGKWGSWHQNSAEIARPLPSTPGPAPVSGLRVVHASAADNRGEPPRQETPRCKLSAEGKVASGQPALCRPGCLAVVSSKIPPAFMPRLSFSFSAQPLPRPFLALPFYDTDSPDGKSLQLKPVQHPILKADLADLITEGY